MKKTTRLLTVAIMLAVVIGLVFGLAACNNPDSPSSGAGDVSASFTLTVNAGKADQLRWAELVKNSLADVGITVTIDAKTAAEFNAATMNGQGDNKGSVNFQAAVTNYTQSGMNMVNGLGTIYADKNHAMQGGAQVDTKVFENILNSLSSAATPEQYNAAARACQEYYAQYLPFVALFWDSSLHAVSDNFSGYITDSDFGAFNSRAWFSMTAANGDRELNVGTTYTFENYGRQNGTYDQMSAALTQQALVCRENGEFKGLLADYATSDGKEWTFTVKEGMKWDDGEAVTAQDILYTLNYLDTYEGKNWFKDVTGNNDKTTPKLLENATVSEDGKSITLTYVKANPRALTDFIAVRIMPEHIYTQYEDSLTTEKPVEAASDAHNRIGCGPYKYSSHDAASASVTFVKNEYYPNQNHNFDKITVRSFNNETALVAALSQGEVDMSYRYSGGLSAEAAKTLKNNGGVNIVPVPAGAVATLMFNTSVAPFNNVNFRKAVMYGLNYAKFLELFGSEYAARPQAGFVPPSFAGYYDGTPVLERNVDLAKSYLATALKEING